MQSQTQQGCWTTLHVPRASLHAGVNVAVRPGSSRGCRSSEDDEVTVHLRLRGRLLEGMYLEMICGPLWTTLRAICGFRYFETQSPRVGRVQDRVAGLIVPRRDGHPTCTANLITLYRLYEVDYVCCRQSGHIDAIYDTAFATITLSKVQISDERPLPR